MDVTQASPDVVGDAPEPGPGETSVLQVADALLARRRHPKWNSMSWTALRPLISSLNQVFIAAAPTLLPELRREWASAHPADDPLRIIDRSDSDRFLVMGDTGEQDRSQYIVTPVLREVAGRDGADFLVICSDVVYPSGDVNDYVHGFYLPYGPLPPEAGGARSSGGSGTDGSQTPDPLASLTLYALPGNHDWHDGLSGFMQHFCGTDRLDLAWFGWPTQAKDPLHAWGEAIMRMVLRRPSRFAKQSLWLPRPDIDGPAEQGYDTAMLIDDFAALRGGRIGQPGSYFAIRTSGVLLVAIDTGIERLGGHNCLDADQGRWLERISALPGPKILLTGSPLLVNARWKECRIDDPLPNDPLPRALAASVNEIVENEANQYIAVIGGDIHNFQHYLINSPDRSRVMHHITSGGGGAYMSATHPVNVVRSLYTDDGVPGTVPGDSADVAAAQVLQENRAMAESATPHVMSRKASLENPVVAPRPNTMIPSPVQSLCHYAELLLPSLWRVLRLLLGYVVGLGLGLVGVHVGVQPQVGGMIALAVAAILLIRIGTPTTWLRTHVSQPLYRGAVVALWGALGVSTALTLLWLDPARAERHIIAYLLYLVGGSVLAWQIRATGWWRPPSWPSERLTWTTIALAATSWLACLGVGVWAGQAVAPGTWRAWVPPGIVVIVGVVGTATFVLVRRRAELAVRWRTLATPLAYGGQLVLMLVAMTTVQFYESPWWPWSVLAGMAGGVLGLITSVLSAAALLYVWCRASGPNWVRLWGVRGQWSQLLAAGLLVLITGIELALSAASSPQLPLIRLITVAMAVVAAVAAAFGVVIWRAGARTAAVVIIAVGVLLALAELTFGALDDATALAVYRVQLGAQLAVITAVTATLTIDQLRRGGTMASAAPRTLAAVLGLILSVGALNLWLGWVAAAAATATVGVLLAVVLIVLVHLAYLRVPQLAFDPSTHQDRDRRGPDRPLLTPADAATFLTWRIDPTRPQAPPVAQRRASIVFPPTDDPHGPVQRKVSEIFDSDAPPFFKNFLQLHVDNNRVLVEVYVVHGTGTVAQESQPFATITIRLPKASSETSPEAKLV